LATLRESSAWKAPRSNSTETIGCGTTASATAESLVKSIANSSERFWQSMTGRRRPARRCRDVGRSTADGDADDGQRRGSVEPVGVGQETAPAGGKAIMPPMTMLIWVTPPAITPGMPSVTRRRTPSVGRGRRARSMPLRRTPSISTSKAARRRRIPQAWINPAVRSLPVAKQRQQRGCASRWLSTIETEGFPRICRAS
jgi:hypothetical protein